MANKGGRPPKYTEWLQGEKLTLIQGWARDGLSDEQIAHNMGIAYSTFKEWKKKFSDFSASLKKGKEVADYEVENATFKNACGHFVEEKTIERRFNKESGEYELVVTKIQERYIPPNPTSQIFLLKKRRPDIYGDGVAGNSEALEAMYAQLDINEERAKEYGAGVFTDAT